MCTHAESNKNASVYITYIRDNIQKQSFYKELIFWYISYRIFFF